MGSQPRQRRQNIAVGGAKPRLVRRSASARRWKRLSETHGCNQNDFSGRLALSGREQSPRPLNAKRPQGPATPQPWVTLRACRRSLHPRLVCYVLSRSPAPARMGPPSSSEPGRGFGAFLFASFSFPHGGTRKTDYGRVLSPGRSPGGNTGDGSASTAGASSPYHRPRAIPRYRAFEGRTLPGASSTNQQAGPAKHIP